MIISEIFVVVPTSEEIRKLVTANGGSYHYYYSMSKVTHIIASNLPTSKINQIRDKKIVKPAWIVDRLSALLTVLNSDLSVSVDLLCSTV